MSDAQPNGGDETVEDRDVISQSRQQDIATARSDVREARLRAKHAQREIGYGQAALDYRSAVEGYVLELLSFFNRNPQRPELWEETADSPPLAVVRAKEIDPLEMADRMLDSSERSFIYQNEYDVPPIESTNFDTGVIAVLPGLQALLDERKQYSAHYEIEFYPRNGGPFTRSTVISEVLTFSQLDKAVNWADQYAQEIGVGLEIGAEAHRSDEPGA